MVRHKSNLGCGGFLSFPCLFRFEEFIEDNICPLPVSPHPTPPLPPLPRAPRRTAPGPRRRRRWPKAVRVDPSGPLGRRPRALRRAARGPSVGGLRPIGIVRKVPRIPLRRITTNIPMTALCLVVCDLSLDPRLFAMPFGIRTVSFSQDPIIIGYFVSLGRSLEACVKYCL